ncbi:hypothetical protein [Phaeacidiphilus oryzae]|uniref:hypothetical protein n=1 Tax=Phaeacidiphilus oryzae TaxID=348818 RepID=UPI000AC47912|nr:hypothetical protein [Phaeacidiphilus oryzae]
MWDNGNEPKDYHQENQYDYYDRGNWFRRLWRENRAAAIAVWLGLAVVCVILFLINR